MWVCVCVGGGGGGGNEAISMMLNFCKQVS